MRYPLRLVALLLAVGAIGAIEVSCGGNDEKKSSSEVVKILSHNHYKRIVSEADDRLMVVDLYADWCMPCKQLSPTIEELAKAYKGRAGFYKVNIDNNPGVARTYNVSGIPLIVFVKDKKQVAAIQGLHPRQAYVEAIERHM